MHSCMNFFVIVYRLLYYGYKFEFVDDKFRKPFKSYLGEDAIYNFINRMLKKSKYCGDLIKNHFNKELVMTKKDY